MSELSREEVFYGAIESEPLEKPTEEVVSEAPVEAIEHIDDESVDGEDVETEELEAEAEEESEDDGDIEYYEINGKEYTAEDIKALENGNLMQSDYTKKTQAIAKEAEVLAEERNLLEADKAKVSDLAAQLEVLVAEDAEIDWAELKEYEPDEYIKQKEKADSRAAKLAEVKANQQPQQQAMTVEDQQALIKANPQWLTDGKQDAENKEYVKDMNMIVNYAATIGLSVQDVQAMNKAGHWFAMLDAAKYAEQKSKGSVLKKKVRKAPKVSKPKAGNNSKPKTREEVFYGTN